MSNLEAEVKDFEAKLEALAAEGFHLVVQEAEKFVIEKVDHVGTVSFKGSSLEDVISLIEQALAKSPGSSGLQVSRSDEIHESLDALQVQAGKPEAPEGQSGTSPSAPIEKVDVAPAAPAVDPSGLVAEQPGEVATGQVGTPEDAPEPEAPAAPEGAVQS